MHILDTYADAEWRIGDFQALQYELSMVLEPNIGSSSFNVSCNHFLSSLRET